VIKGKNPTLLKVTYVRPDRKREIKECFQVIYMDDDENVHYAEEPGEADIYIVKPEYRTYTYNKPEERMEKMDKIRVPISEIRWKISQEAGNWGRAIREASVEHRDAKILNQLYKWPYAYGCDFQPEYYYYKNWYERYPLNTPKLTRAFLDIEIDQIDYIVDMDNVKDTAYAPVNLVTVLLEATKDVYTFILRPFKPVRSGRSDEEWNKRIQMYEHQVKQHEYMMNHLDEFYDKCHKDFDQIYGHLNYHIREYEREIELIADVFRLINTRKPNFCEIWNMRFDIAYLCARVETLGYDPTSIMCHKDIPNPVCRFIADKSTYQLEKQFDFFYCSSYTQFICQMRLYASIRKSQHKLRSVKLNDIGDRELRDKKVEYPDAANIITFPYTDWGLFWAYNIKDVLIQYGIERKCNDLTTYYMRSHSNLTPYNKIFRETHLLRNVREMYFEKDGWVQGNNLNIIDEHQNELERRFFGSDEDEEENSSFKGAINAEPTMNDRVGKPVLGVPSNNIYENSMDYDMGAFYPSIKIASNMDPITLKYKASFDNDEFISGEFSNRSLNQKYEEKDKNNKLRKLDITGEAVNTFASKNILTFAYNFLGLPNIAQLYGMVKKYIQNKYN